MHLKVIDGKPLYVGLAEKREARMERLANRYNPPGPGKGFMKGGKGDFKGDKGMGKGGKGMMPGKGMPSPGGYPPMMFAMPQGQGMPPMNPQLMMQQQAMKGQMMGGKGMPMMPMMGMMRPPMPMMMRPPMPGMPMPMPGQPLPGPPKAAGGAPLSQQQLAGQPPQVQRQMIGEKLYPMVQKYNAEMAGKITGMMLEMTIPELQQLLESEAQLKNKVDEALRVLNSGGA